ASTARPTGETRGWTASSRASRDSWGRRRRRRHATPSRDGQPRAGIDLAPRVDRDQARRVGGDGEVGERGAGWAAKDVADGIEAAPVAAAVETLRRDRALLAHVAARVRAD